MSGRRWRSRGRPRSMSRPGSRASRASRTPPEVRAFVRAVREADAAPRRRLRAAYDDPAAQFLPHRTRRVGHFGIYGGRFVAETLMPLILELEKAYAAAKDDPGLPEGDGRLSHALCRAAVAALFRRAADRAFRRRENLLQARGAQSHRRAQGEQRARPDHAGAPHGQDPHHRRDRRRHAWRCDRDAVRALRSALHRLHGRGRCRAAEAERVPHEDAGRRGGAGAVRLEDAEGRDERGAARLGHQCRRHLLLHRHGRGPASLSDDGARLSVRDRQRDARADEGSRRPAAGFADRLHRRRLQRDGTVSSLPRRQGRRDLRRRSRGPRHSVGTACGLGLGRASGRAARQPHLSADGRGRPDQRSAFDLGRSRLSRHRPGACLARRYGPREISVRDRRRGGRGVAALLEARRHHSGARDRACARQAEGSRADEAEGSPDGGQSLRPRRQGSRRASREYLGTTI